MAYPPGGGRISKEIDEYMLRVYKTEAKAQESQRLPKFWNTKDRSRHLRLSHFALSITYSGGFSERHDANYTNGEAACVRADAPIPLTTGIYYFEITVSSRSNNGRSIAVGVATKASSLVKLPGTEHSSFAYHSDGSVFHGSPTLSTKFGPRFAENDTVGCGVDFISRSLFFTRNGVFLGKAFEGKIPASPGTRLYPAVGLQGRGTRLSTNFGQRPFSYAFETHIDRERALQEKQLIDRVCKEEFAGPKMRELVSGYLVHHGYVSTAQAFSRWSSVPNSPTHLANVTNQKENRSPLSVQRRSSNPDPSRSSNSCTSSCLDSPGTEPSTDDSPSGTPAIVRRHSDSACMVASSQFSVLPLPGLASMLHRRRLRALCRRCQYGRAAATLNRLYPQVLESCPELLVQLRCRQLIEMMRRHAVRRGRNAAFDPAWESSSTSSATAPPKVQKTSGSQNVRSGCCVSSDRSDRTISATREVHQNGALSTDIVMDVDCEEPSHRLNGQPEVQPLINAIDDTKTSANSEQLPSVDGDNLLMLMGDVADEDVHDADECDEDEDDDDGFGMDDDTGVSLNTPLTPASSTSPAIPTRLNHSKPVQSASSPSSPRHSNTAESSREKPSSAPSITPIASTSGSSRMEVDGENERTESLSTSSTTTSSPLTSAKRRSQTDLQDSMDADEMRCLLRHVQFGRSLVNLVKQVRAKVGGLSLETERLLQQSVSLLAYPSPAANDCPLRGLLDPVWRDTIASVINSAVLKAHDLPVQPALEQGLRALQRCFQDQYFVEAQTLGHFLLYHLTPNQVDAAKRAVASTAVSSTGGSENSGDIDCSKIDPSSSPPSSSSANERLSANRSRVATTTRRSGVPNGHSSEHRRRSTRRGIHGPSTTTTLTATEEQQTHCAYDIEDCSSSSSMDETSRKEDDDEDDEDEDEDDADEDVGHGCLDDVEHDGGEEDDDEPDGGQSTGASRGRHHSTRDYEGSTGGSSGGSRGNSGLFRGEQGSNGADGGGTARIQSSTLTHGSAPSPVLRTRRALVARFCQSIVLDDPHTRIHNSTNSPISSLPPRVSPRCGLGSLRNQTNIANTTSTSPIPRFRPQSAAAPVAISRSGSGNSSNNICLSDPDDTSNNPRNLDSAFHGLVSLSYPQHTEFLSAMNDALKAYAGSLLLTDEEQSASCSLTPPTGPVNQGDRGGGGAGAAGPSLPPSPGGGTCAP
ncbi:Ran-binding protein 9 [Fasciola hepatica]|uniref:Ran-binding protein 9 n=1 Tax=Fasciola hepatica TaxID=6192 RepID=A0A4E0RA04_FASHE|nr:Ran-binding protein 9 [Fasciola hepatica]